MRIVLPFLLTVLAFAATPTTAKDHEYALHLLAVGDWGVTLDGESSLKNYKKETPRNDTAYYRNFYSQRNVAHLMGESAKQLKPAAVLGHGDSFYWSGLGPNDTESRFLATFEQVYDHPTLQEVPWYNVMGNHDYGGAYFICDHECKSPQQLLAALEAKFQRQQTYKSPYNSRWTLRDHYYKETLKDPKSDVSIDLFNVDMNASDRREKICCQCKSYRQKMQDEGQEPPSCDEAKRGHALCAGGSTEMFDACVQQLDKWQDESLRHLTADTKQSNATWKIVHSHYAPQHSFKDGPVKDAWYNALKEGGVQLFINGHVHAEAHEYADFQTHFITNGAGGGSQSEKMKALSPNETHFQRLWEGEEGAYGFFELSFGKKHMRTQFVTFGDDWVFGNGTATKHGSSKVGHCHLIPVDGSQGMTCEGTLCT